MDRFLKVALHDLLLTYTSFQREFQILSATEKSPQQVAIHGDLIVQQGVRLGDESIVVAKDAGDTLVKLGTFQQILM